MQFYRFGVSSGYNLNLERCVLRLCGYPMYSQGNAVLKDCTICFVGTSFGDGSAGSLYDNCYILGAATALNTVRMHPKTNVTIIGATTGVNTALNGKVTLVCCSSGIKQAFLGEVIAHKVTTLFSGGKTVDAKIYADGCAAITDGYYGSLYGEIKNSTLLTGSGTSDLHFCGKIDVFTGVSAATMNNLVLENTVIGTTLRPFTSGMSGGSITSIFETDAGWVQVPSYNPWGLLFIALGTGTTWLNPIRLNFTSHCSMWCPQSRTSITFKVRPTGFATALTDLTLLIDILYLNADGTISRAINTTAVYANDEWSSITVPIAPGKDGMVLWNISLCSGPGNMLLDPLPILA